MRDSYNDISRLCHETREPVFITKNGQGYLAVMSIGTDEILNGKLESSAIIPRNWLRYYKGAA